MDPQQALPVLTFSLQNSADGVRLLLTLSLAPEALLLLSYFQSLCLTPQPSFFTLPCNQILPLLSSAHLLTVLTSGWRRTLASQCFRLSVCLFFYSSLSPCSMSFSPSYLHECNYC